MSIIKRISPRFLARRFAMLVGLVGLLGVLQSSACIRDSRNIHAASTQPERLPSGVGARSWALCPLLGPAVNKPGVYGSDLGFSVQDPMRGAAEPRLAMLFGDTWAKPSADCQYPVTTSDDMQAWLPARRPQVLRPGTPNGAEAKACHALSYSLTDAKDVTSWPRLRLFPSSVAKSADALMDTGMLRTPVAAFSDGKHLFSIVGRNDPVYCEVAADCPAAMSCTKDPKYKGKPLGICGDVESLGSSASIYCRDDHDCLPTVDCTTPQRGLCVARAPFTMHTPTGDVSPRWYHDDPRLGVANTMYIAAAIWPDRPTDYAVVHRFATQRFVNVTARTVKHFDPEDPSKNDYAPGTETVLVWGRAAFVSRGGAQSLPFLFYQRMDTLIGAPPAANSFKPKFFSGYLPNGKPRWSADENDAQPIYGANAKLVNAGGERLSWPEPELDYVNQMSVSWVAPLRRWVMLYGGDVPAFLLADPSTGHVPEQVHKPRAPGAIHMRVSPHPWGSLSAARAQTEGWSSAKPVLTRRNAAEYLACGDGGQKELPGCIVDDSPHGALDLLATFARASVESSIGNEDDAAAKCLQGELAMSVQQSASGNRIGRLYGVNIIEQWTEDVTDRIKGLRPNERAAEVYWNVSTWNPYGVILVKTQLRARDEPAR